MFLSNLATFRRKFRQNSMNVQKGNTYGTLNLKIKENIGDLDREEATKIVEGNKTNRETVFASLSGK